MVVLKLKLAGATAALSNICIKFGSRIADFSISKFNIEPGLQD